MLEVRLVPDGMAQSNETLIMRDIIVDSQYADQLSVKSPPGSTERGLRYYVQLWLGELG